MKKILIIGATGMAGHTIFHYLDGLNNYQMYNTVYRDKLTEDSIFCNVINSDKVEDLIEDIRPDVVINCVGALITQSRDNPASAIYLNACLPHKLKEFSENAGARLIHLSTDCVFSGRDGNYAESDFRDADDIYGRSKALGEIFSEPHATLRTSIIGPELKKNGEGLFHWFMQQEGEIQGFTNAYWSGITTLELARAIQKVVESELTGLLHVTNGTPISKYELLNLFKNIFASEVKSIVPQGKYRVNKSLQSSEKFDFEIPGYDKMISDMEKWIDETHPELYSQYKT